jgi:vancomycin resistance protein YoaR
VRQSIRLSNMFRPAFVGRPQVSGSRSAGALRTPAVPLAWLRTLSLAAAGVAAVLGLVLAVSLVSVRTTHAERIFPALTVADVPVGGMPFGTAAAALDARAQAIESSPVAFTYKDRTWQSTLRDIGVSVDATMALDRAVAFGREGSALNRLRSAAAFVRSGEHLAMPMTLDYRKLDGWFDQIDRDLGVPPHNASYEIQGTNVIIVPEVDGTVVDRDRAQDIILAQLQNLEPVSAELPVSTKIASVRKENLEPGLSVLQNAMSHPIQVTSGGGVWTLPATDISQFLTQNVSTGTGGAPTLTLSLDRDRLAAWLDEKLGAAVETDPVDAIVGWNGERVVSVEPSVDGSTLDADKLAEVVEGRFFGDGGKIEAPLNHTKPTIDSNNLGALGITTLLGTGQSNYSGSTDGRAHNVEVGASLLNGTLVPPWGEFSFNGAIGLIDDEKGFVEAQVIDGEKIGKDIGGGICQVSTTVFRAAYLAGLPIDEWWPHRFRIGFYEYDGWEPGLDASILQPTDDPSTWADFKFENPSDSWMLVEAWSDGTNVVVNLYGADLGYQVETTGPTWGDKFQMLPPQEVIDDELPEGTVTLSQQGTIGEELSQYRVVRDRTGELLWERSFYTKYYPRGDVWKVSEDMKGQAPIDPDYKFPPLPPAGIDSKLWVPGQEVAVAPSDSAASTESWSADATAPVEEWVPPSEDAASG